MQKITKLLLKPIKNIGNKQLAEATAKRSFDEVKAYKKFLTHKELNHLPISFEDLPLTSKDSYIIPSDHFDLLAGSDQTIFYYRSSSLNNSLYWPQPKLTKEKILLFKQYLEYHYHINTIKSVCIVGTSLGSWAGGQNFAYCLEHFSHLIDYPISIFTPGSNVEEIIEFILKYHLDVPQFILFLCPSFIAYILDAVEDLGLHSQFPFHKVRFLVVGEPFTECFRAHLDTVCGVNIVDSSLFSVYGTADTDFIGAESLASVAIRKLIYQDSSLAQQMGFRHTLPHFFHCYAQDSYIEEVNEELCITKWQGIPLLRYNLHDKVQLYSWKELRDFVLAYKLENQQNNPLYQVIEKAGENLPDVIALFGRADSNLKLKGTLISETILDHILHSKTLSEFITGNYKASVEYDEHDHQYLSLLLEIKPSIDNSPDLSNFFYSKIIEGLCELQHEFKTDYEAVYKKFDNDPAKKILRLEVCKWPFLSKELLTKTKRRGIKKEIANS